MSTSHEGKPVFNSSPLDPCRAREVLANEYEELLYHLEHKVLPKLALAAARIALMGYRIMKLERNGGLASLVVKNSRRGSDGWLYFQIHRSFGPLLSSERVFWMFSVRRNSIPDEGKAGRLLNLTESISMDEIVSDFVRLLSIESAPSKNK